MAGRHPKPGDPPLLGRLTSTPADNSQYYQGGSARWYTAVNAWRTDDLPFYQAQAGRWAGPAGSVLELGCGNGRVAIPLARAGFRVAALDSSEPMLSQLRDHLGRESEDVRLRVEPIQDDMRRFNLDRIFRLICLPFNSMLLLVQPQERQATLERVREHLAPSGAFAFDIFTPDPTRLVDDRGWTVDLDFETNNPDGEGRVRVLRESRRQVDLGRQIISIRFRYRISAEGGEPASWEDALDLAYIFPRELELILERQGFRITERFGDPGGSAFEPTPDRIQQQFVVAQLIP